MIIYPAIDLMNNQCVRLHKGKFDEITSYATDAVSVAQNFAEHGAEYLHVVDLDGAKQQAPQHDALIKKIVENTSLQVQTGGGIRTTAQIQNLLDNGVQRVILGSIAIHNKEQVKKWFIKFGADHIVLAFDTRISTDGTPILATHGWQENSNLSLWQLLDIYQEVAVQHILCTDIDRDGTLMGPNVELYKTCMERYPNVQLQASGGIKNILDLHELASIPTSAAIIGKALYENKIKLSEALQC